MGKLIQFPSDHERNKEFQEKAQEQLETINRSMNIVYSNSIDLVNDLLFAIHENYIDEKNSNYLFEATISEIIKLYLANSNYQINDLYEKLKNF